MEYYSAIKKNEIRKMDGTGDCHIKWSKADSEGQRSHFLSYVESKPKK
jgi:hypothetical protein